MPKTINLTQKTQPSLWSLLFAVLALALALSGLAGCSSSQKSSDASASSSASATEKKASETEPVEVRVAALKGPTAMGISKFAQDAAAGKTKNTFNFTVSGTADEVLPGVIQGNFDIAMIPSNMAAVAYNKTQGGISIIDINTLGVLYVVSGKEIASLGELKGATIHMAGKAASPGYATSFLLNKAGIAESVAFDWKTENQEAAAAVAADPNSIAILPEPFATATLMQNPNLVRGLKLSDAWDGEVEDGSQLIQGVTVVRNDFLKDHPEAVEEFIEQHKASVKYVNSNPEEAAQGIVDLGIMDKAPAAAKAIPNASLVAIDGEEMAEALSGYLKVLFDADPTSVGGTLPDDAIYYVPNPGVTEKAA